MWSRCGEHLADSAAGHPHGCNLMGLGTMDRRLVPTTTSSQKFGSTHCCSVVNTCFFGCSRYKPPTAWNIFTLIYFIAGFFCAHSLAAVYKLVTCSMSSSNKSLAS